MSKLAENKDFNEVFENNKMKVAIQTLDDKQGYIVTCEAGREFIVRNIDEAIKLKEELQNECS